MRQKALFFKTLLFRENIFSTFSRKHDGEEAIKVFYVDKEKKETRAAAVLSGVLCMVYFCCFVYGALGCPHQLTSTLPLLVMLSALGGMVLSFLPYLTKAILHVKISIPVNVGIQCFGLIGICFGETFGCYYRFSFWDDIMHFSSGFWVTYLAYCFLSALKGEDALSHPKAFLSMGAFAISLSIGLLWEIYEFTSDSLWGTDMQKTIPEGDLFNGGNTFAVLAGDDATIAAFFRSPKGYRYALQDTMSDLVECFFGSTLFEILCWPLEKRHPNFEKGQIVFSSKGLQSQNAPGTFQNAEAGSTSEKTD